MHTRPENPVAQSAAPTAHDGDFTAITELPGGTLSTEQWLRMHHRYALACRLARHRRVLEVACGAGVGLTSLARRASVVVGGDYTSTVLGAAQAVVAQLPSIPTAKAPTALAQFDAQQMPFGAAEFDLLLCFEAIYYLPQPEDFVREAQRVLKPGGHLLIGSENPAWPAFTPGKFSTRYWPIPELAELVQRHGFVDVEAWGAFPVDTYSPRQQVMARMRRFVIQQGLMPRHPRLRQLLQRLGYGALRPLPRRLDETLLAGQGQQGPGVPLSLEQTHPTYKVYYLQASVP